MKTRTPSPLVTLARQLTKLVVDESETEQEDDIESAEEEKENESETEGEIKPILATRFTLPGPSPPYQDQVPHHPIPGQDPAKSTFRIYSRLNHIHNSSIT